MADVMSCMEIWGGNQGMDEFVQRPGLAVWVHSRPCENSTHGGDVYYLSSCASGRISRLLLADVSGHGPAVSGFASRLRDLMRRFVNRISQNLLVEEINREFVELNHDGQFATALVATFYASNRSLQVSLAGHPRPLLFRNATRTWDVYDFTQERDHAAGVRNLAWGIMKEATYGAGQLYLEPGDMVLAYTDGLTETRVEQKSLLETDGLLRLVRSLDPDRPETLLQNILANLRERMTAPISDDLSIMLLKADGSRPTLWDTVVAPVRLLGGVHDNTRLR